MAWQSMVNHVASLNDQNGLGVSKKEQFRFYIIYGMHACTDPVTNCQLLITLKK